MFSTVSYAGGGCCDNKREKRCKHRDHHGGYKDWKKKSSCCSDKDYDSHYGERRKASYCGSDGFHNDYSKPDDCHGAWIPDCGGCDMCYKGKTHDLHSYLDDAHHSCDMCYKGASHDWRYWDENHSCAFDHPCDKDHDHHRSYATRY